MKPPKALVIPSDRETVSRHRVESEAAPVTPTEKQDSPDGKAKESRRWIRPALFTLLPIALVLSGYQYVSGGSTMSTDNAYVQADVVGISTDVSGIVKAVDVTENERVTTNQILYQLDDLPFQLAVTRARAHVDIVRNDLLALQASYRDTQEQVRQGQEDLAYYDRELMRQQYLNAQHVSSEQTLEAARRSRQSAQQKLASLQQHLAGIAATLNGNPNASIEQHPQYLDAVAQAREAARQLGHAIVRAPFDGIVTDVPSITPGRYLQASTTAFYLVATDHVWVDAKPKETQLTHVRPGQPVDISVDTYPSSSWKGVVESISPAAAQQFSLLPAQNTSGNWVKVVQRIPMRIRVDISDGNLPPLRAGMSAIVDVHTGHRRGMPFFADARSATLGDN